MESNTHNTTVLQLVAADETGDTLHRMRWPAEELARQRPDWRVINLDAGAAERIMLAETADLLVVYQSHDLDLLPMLMRRRARGLKTLVEYNDNYYQPPKTSPVCQEWSSPLLWQTYEEFMRMSDGVIVTCPALGDLLKEKVDKPFFVLKNHCSFDLPDLALHLKNKNDGFRFGWAGSVGHAADIIAAAPTIIKFLNDNQETIFHMMGNESLPRVLGVPPNRMKFENWGGMTAYLKFWQSVQVGIVPLLDSPYNRCRSDVKAIEMVSQGVLPILPDSEPYKDFLNATGLPKWEKWSELREILDLYRVNSTRWREDLARAYEYVRTNRSRNAHAERLELYSQFLPDKPLPSKWPVGTGFHQLRGTPAPGPIYTEILSIASKKLRDRDGAGALAFLEKEVSADCPIADLVLALGECARQVGDRVKARETFQRGIKRFPLDLRFYLASLTTAENVHDSDEIWGEILVKLDNEGEIYSKYFENEVIANVITEIEARGELPPCYTVVRLQYPDSYQLQCLEGELYAHGGDDLKALGRFSGLLELSEKRESIEHFFKSNSPGYLWAWNEALESRRRGGIR